MLRRFRIIPLTLAVAMLVPGAAWAKLRVAASTNDLASIASSVGGPEVEVFSIAKPSADVHRIEVLPSYMVKVSKAQIFLKVGLGLDQWADGIIDGSRNTHIKLVDCSEDVPVLEKPTKVDASMGDVHPFGNPHYWLDPRNGGRVALTVAEAFAKVDPAHAQAFHDRAEAFAKQADEAWKRGQQGIEKIDNKTMITYHASWSYFANAFDFKVLGTAEPVPGIPPTAKHLADIVGIVKSRHVPVFLQEPYFSSDAGKFLARETEIKTVVASPSCDAPTAGSYLAHFDTILRGIASVAAKSASAP
jgi:zinc/manganese transport system substrate-binding protein